MDRRTFLKSAGAALLTVPFLESRRAQAAASGPPPRVIFLVHHQGYYPSGFYPTVNQWQQGPDGVRSVSLRAISGALSSALPASFDPLRDKMNILKGLDVITPLSGHNNCAATTASINKGAQDTAAPIFPYSADTILSQSTTLYPSAPFRKVLRFTPMTTQGSYVHNFSWDAKTGTAQLAQQIEGPQNVFREYFLNNSSLPGPSTPTSADPNVARRAGLSLALQRYETLAKSTKLSSADRQRLAQHRALLGSVVDGLQAPVVSQTASCTAPASPSNMDSKAISASARYGTCFDLLTAILVCRLTNVATFVMSHVSDKSDRGDDDPYHNYVFHVEFNQASYLGYKSFVLDQVRSFVTKLDGIVEENGKTVLDNSLVVVLSEHGVCTYDSGHLVYDMPIITFGTLGGRIRAGRFVNYEQAGAPKLVADPSCPSVAGRSLGNFYTTIFNALGMPPSDYERGGVTGFGQFDDPKGLYAAFSSTAARRASLPLL